jgi:hypothetical protein
MKFTLRRPCAECPFRNDRPGYLRPERVRQLATELLSGSTFACHKTCASATDEDGNDDRVEAIDSQMCAGARAFQHYNDTESQLERIALRLGGVGVVELGADLPVHRTVSALVAAQPGYEEPEGEPCSICDDGCEAPAGHLIGGAIVDSGKTTSLHCDSCGQPVCASCSKVAHGEGRICNDCIEYEEENA